MADILYVVIPCYKEQEVLPETARRLRLKMTDLISENRISEKSKVLFVNDGSTDDTWNIIKALHKMNSLYAGINLSRNRGHQNALLAGLMVAKEKADVVISMDADLQDDINAIDNMLDKYYEGYDIVYGVRNSRETDTFFKRFTAETFYKLMKVMGADIVYNHADYRLMSKRALNGLAQFKEVNLFLRGIVPEIGYKSTTVEYKRSERYAGESKYPLKKMLTFAIDGITSFTVKPIRWIITFGFMISFFSIIALVWSFVVKFSGDSQAGWSSLIASIWLLGGIQLLSIGIIGEYIGKIYKETKQRPRYIIETILMDNMDT